MLTLMTSGAPEPSMRISDAQQACHGRARRVGIVAHGRHVGRLHAPRRAAAAAVGDAAACCGSAAPAVAHAVAPATVPFVAKLIVAQLVLACVDVGVMKVGSDGEVGSGACRGAPPRLLMHDRTVWAGRAFRFGGKMDEATAHLDAHGNAANSAAAAAAAAAGYGGRCHCDAAARVWLLLMRLVCGDRAHGHVAEPVVDIFAPQLDLSAPRPPADHRQAAQQPNNRREHADDEDGDGVAIGAVQRARRPLRGRR